MKVRIEGERVVRWGEVRRGRRLRYTSMVGEGVGEGLMKGQ